jgi:vitamin B12 transporter
MGKWGIMAGAAAMVTLILAGGAGAVVSQPEKVELEAVVVSGTGTEVPVKESTQSSTTITAREIEERQAVRVEELLRYVPGVTISQSGSRGGTTSLYLRGGQPNQTQVLFNGIRLNNTGGSFDFNALTTDNLQRLEVVRGPMSALYGADAMVGVVNLFTQKGRGGPTLNLATGWGPHAENGWLIGEQRASLMGSYQMFSYSLGYTRVDDPGILPLNNRFYSNTLVGRLDLDPTDNLTFTYNTLLLQNRFGFPTVNSGDIFDPKAAGGPGLDPVQYNKRLNLVQGLTGNYWPFPWWEHEATLAYNQITTSYRNPANPFYSDFDLLFGSYFSDDVERRLSVDYHTNLRFGSKDKVQSISTLGFQYRTEKLKQWTWASSPWGTYASFLKVARHANAFYAQEQLNLYNRVFLVGGLRVEDNTVFATTQFIPRGSVAVRFPETDTTIRAGGGKAIKEPTFLESYSRSQLSKANPNLKPERNLAWEVGVDQYAWQDRVQLSATFFQNNFSDFITFVPRDWPQLSSFENIGAVRVNGLEFSTRIKPVQGLTLGLVYTNLLYFKVTDDGGIDNLYFKQGKNLLRRPRHTFSFVADYTWDRLNLNLTGIYTGARDDSRIVYTFPFSFDSVRVRNGDNFILNLAASYDVVRRWGYVDKIQLWARLHNLLDRNYQETYGYTSPGFFMVGGLRVVFGPPAGTGQGTTGGLNSAPLPGTFSSGLSRPPQEQSRL